MESNIHSSSNIEPWQLLETIKLFDVGKRSPCSYCKARPGESCRTKSGKETYHRERSELEYNLSNYYYAVAAMYHYHLDREDNNGGI